MLSDGGKRVPQESYIIAKDKCKDGYIALEEMQEKVWLIGLGRDAKRREKRKIRGIAFFV